MQKITLNDTHLMVGDRIRVVMEVPGVPYGRTWAWEGVLEEIIPANHKISLDRVTEMYGVPTHDANGFYTRGWANMAGKPSATKEPEYYRERDWAAIMRRYQNWQSVGINRFVFRKDNGYLVVMPGVMALRRATASMDFWEPHHQEWLKLL